MIPNKHFNTYKEGLDLEFLRAYCMEHGERRVMERGETLEEAGEPAQWVAFVERGSSSTWCITTRRARTTARALPSRASSCPTSRIASTATCRR